MHTSRKCPLQMHTERSYARTATRGADPNDVASNRVRLQRIRFVFGVAIVLLVVWIGASSASAQTIVDTETFEFPMRTFSASGSDPYTRTLVGRFNDGLQRDVAILRDGKVILFPNPTIWNAGLEYPPSGVNDMALFAGATKDKIVTVDSNGLRSWSRNSSAGTYSTATIGSSAWNGALIVRAADLDGANGIDFYGVNSSGTSILVTIDNGSGYTTTSFSVADAPTNLCALQFDGSGDLEIAVIDEDSVDVYELDGTVVTNTSANTDGFIVALHDNTAYDKVVMMYENMANADVVRILSYSGGLGSASAIATIDPVQMIAGDVDDDGDEDLVLTSTSGYRVMVVENQSGAFASTGKQWIDYGTSGSAPDVEAWPALGDIDHDGDIDIIVPDQDEEHMVFLLSQEIDEDAMKPVLNTNPIYSDIVWDGGVIDYRTLIFSVDNPTSVPAGATHLEVLFYVRDSVSVGTTTNTYAVHIGVESGEYTYVVGPVVGDVDDTVETQTYYWVQRFVAKSGSAYTAVYPASGYAMIPVDWVTGGGTKSDQQIELETQLFDFVAGTKYTPSAGSGDSPGGVTGGGGGGGGGGSGGFDDDDEPEDGEG